MSNNKDNTSEEEQLNVDDLNIPNVPDAVRALLEAKKSITPESTNKDKTEKKE